jgi:hypothetical protein
MSLLPFLSGLLGLLLPAIAAAQGTSLRVINDRNLDPNLIQRVRIVIGGYNLGADLSEPMDLGDPANAPNGSFTIELWLRGAAAENTLGGSGCQYLEYSWINCSIVVDRDINGNPSFGKFGLSVCRDGAVRVGVTDGTTGTGICAPNGDVLDSAWHHVALTRNGASGELCLFVDGVQGGCGQGPIGKISWNDTRGVQSPAGQDPTFSLGAEKHGIQGESFPGFRGWLDEARFSSVVRYAPCGDGATCFPRPTAPFSADASTLGLYHFDDGVAGDPCSCAGPLMPLVQGTCLADASGYNTHAECRYGSTEGRFGPRFSSYTPFGPVDSDGDGVPNTDDLCPYRADAQADTGGYRVAIGDGIGNACQCGDTDGDNALFPLLDIDRVRNTLAGLSPGVVDLAKCSVAGGASDCDLLDLVILRRNGFDLGPGIANVCDAAVP